MITGTEAAQKLSRLSSSGSDLLDKIKAWWKPIWNLLTLRLMDGVIVPKTSLSVSIERGAIWVVLGSRFLSRIRIKRFRKYAFEEGKYINPEGLAHTLSLAMEELKAKKKGITLAIPREWAIVKALELPATVKETIADVIAYELDRLTPLSPDNAYYDFRILDEHDERLNLILVAARADLINQYREALRKEDITVEKVTINLSNLATLCAYMGQETDSICLEVDSYGYEGGLIRNNLLSSSIGGSFFGNETREAAIMDALNPLIEMVQPQGVSPTVLLSVKDQDYVSLVGHLNVPVKILENEAVKLKLLTGMEGISLSAVGGIVENLWSKAKGVNLFGKGVREKARLPIACTVILIALILATWIPYVVVPLEREEKRLDEINRQIALRKDQVKRIEGLQVEVDALNSEVMTLEKFKESSPVMLVLLKELTTILPNTVWLTRTRITDTTVDIEGYANSALEILPKLEQSKYLKKVEFASPTVRDTRLNADRFTIKMDIEGFTKEGGKRPKEGGERPINGKKK